MYIVEDDNEARQDRSVSAVIRENSMFRNEHLGEYLPKIIANYADVRGALSAMVNNPDNKCTLQLAILDIYRDKEPKLLADEAVVTIDLIYKDSTFNRFWCPLSVWKEAMGYEIRNKGKSPSEIF